jgi:hypothetical protein
MRLEGSCHCGAARFAVESPHPYPFNLCYCRGCRKTAGAGGYAINLSGRAETLEVEGEDAIVVYRPGHNSQERRFCGRCGTALWIQDPRWPDLVHPHASAVDTELPTPPERTHLMLEFKAGWVPVHADPQDKQFQGYPDESIAAWHARLGLQRQGDA